MSQWHYGAITAAEREEKLDMEDRVCSLDLGIYYLCDLEQIISHFWACFLKILELIHTLSQGDISSLFSLGK